MVHEHAMPSTSRSPAPQSSRPFLNNLYMGLERQTNPNEYCACLSPSLHDALLHSHIHLSGLLFVFTTSCRFQLLIKHRTCSSSGIRTAIEQEEILHRQQLSSAHESYLLPQYIRNERYLLYPSVQPIALLDFSLRTQAVLHD